MEKCRAQINLRKEKMILAEESSWWWTFYLAELETNEPTLFGFDLISRHEDDHSTFLCIPRIGVGLRLSLSQFSREDEIEAGK